MLVTTTVPSIEELAGKVEIHPKVKREALKLAFLAPNIVTAIFAGDATFGLADLRNVSVLSWQSQREELHQARSNRIP
jgi:site-specific DNA recombinase